MKVAVITRHAITNYGSLLQAFATQKAIESLGHECQIIDYIRKDESPSEIEKTLLATKSEWNCSALKRALYLAIRQPDSMIGSMHFETERKKLLNLTTRYSSLEELNDNLPDADVYVTGSNQVWGPVMAGEYDWAYLLSFVPDGLRKVSYAASFGKRVPEGKAASDFKFYLSRYNEISVREDSAINQLAEWEFESSQVIDPTLLLDANEWREFAGSREAKTEYVLVYQIHNDPSVGRYAKRVAEHLGLPLIRVSVNLHQLFREGKLEYLPSLKRFLSLIDNANVLITDSFHGTAFAINLNTPFIEVLPNSGTASRNASILRLMGLENRILKNEADLDLVDMQIDFAYVNKRLFSERQSSLTKLNDLITG